MPPAVAKWSEIVEAPFADPCSTAFVTTSDMSSDPVLVTSSPRCEQNATNARRAAPGASRPVATAVWNGDAGAAERTRGGGPASAASSASFEQQSGHELGGSAPRPDASVVPQFGHVTYVI